MSQVTPKVNIRWKENNFELRRLFTSNVSFLFEPVVLYISQKDHSKRSFLETISHRIASQYLLISTEREMPMVTKLMLCSELAWLIIPLDLPVFSYNFYQNLILSMEWWHGGEVITESVVSEMRSCQTYAGLLVPQAYIPSAWLENKPTLRHRKLWLLIRNSPRWVGEQSYKFISGSFVPGHPLIEKKTS